LSISLQYLSLCRGYGLVSVSKGKLKTEPLYVDMKLAYDEDQKNKSMRQGFLTPPLFANLAKRLEGKPIPEYLDKLVIREHQVPQVIANRIAGYFLDGARDSGMINKDGVITKQITGCRATIRMAARQSG
jgi:hypothetical protein